MTTIATSIRMDEELKKEAMTRLEALGLNFNTFVVMATKQLIAQEALPFSTAVPKTYLPTEKTANALKNAEAWANNPDEKGGYTSVEALRNALEG